MELRTNVRAVVKCAIADPRYAWELRDSGLKAALTGTNSADWQEFPSKCYLSGGTPSSARE